MVIIFFLSAPIYLGSYVFYLVNILLINIIVVVSFRFVSLMGGWSFVHAALWGMGAYTSAILTVRFGLPVGFGILMAALSTGVCTMLIAIPILRTRGVYFILSTFATMEIIRQVWIRFRNLFRGHVGFNNIPAIPDVPYYYLVLVLTGLSVLLMYLLERSRLGRATKSIASDEFLAESLGINTWRYRAMAFVIGGFFVGLAGGLLAHKVGAVTPADFTFVTMLGILIAALLGGTRTIIGPIIGVSLLTIIQYFGHSLLDWLPMFLGGIMIAIITVLPDGLESLPHRISALTHKQGKNR
jgi:branched-chain amino acid transport system permease protein